MNRDDVAELSRDELKAIENLAWMVKNSKQNVDLRLTDAAQSVIKICVDRMERSKPISPSILEAAQRAADEIQELNGSTLDRHCGLPFSSEIRPITLSHLAPHCEVLGQSSTWFSYDPGAGFETHNTEAAAREQAEKSLDYYKDESSEGWSDEVAQVCWGKVAQKVEMLWYKTRPPKEELDENNYDKDGLAWRDWDEMCDYALCPAIAAAEAVQTQAQEKGSK